MLQLDKRDSQLRKRGYSKGSVIRQVDPRSVRCVSVELRRQGGISLNEPAKSSSRISGNSQTLNMDKNRRFGKKLARNVRSGDTHGGTGEVPRSGPQANTTWIETTRSIISRHWFNRFGQGNMRRLVVRWRRIFFVCAR